MSSVLQLVVCSQAHWVCMLLLVLVVCTKASLSELICGLSHHFTHCMTHRKLKEEIWRKTRGRNLALGGNKAAHYHFNAAITGERRYSEQRRFSPLNLIPVLSQVQFQIKVHNVKPKKTQRKIIKQSGPASTETELQFITMKEPPEQVPCGTLRTVPRIRTRRNSPVVLFKRRYKC